MLTKRLIPCLDVRNGRVVKGIQFQGLRDAGDPVQCAKNYTRQGADELIILDVSATPDGRKTSIETVSAVRAVLDLPLTVGGGVRHVDDARRLLDAGADRVATNSAAVANPNLLNEISSRFGRQCTVLAIDAARTDNGNWELVTQSGTARPSIDAIDWAQESTKRGVGEILLTSWDRDGTRRGYDLELIAAVTKVISIPVIASGGANTPDHMVAAIHAGASAVLAASIFHEGDYTLKQVKTELAKQKVRIRPC